MEQRPVTFSPAAFASIRTGAAVVHEKEIEVEVGTGDRFARVMYKMPAIQIVGPSATGCGWKVDHQERG